MTNRRPAYRADVDGLRGIAVISVVGFHAFPGWFSGGFIGVDIFFVISGFLISSIIFSSLQSNTFSFMEFYARRIRRIFPALVVVLGVSSAYGWFSLTETEYGQLRRQVAAGAAFVSNFALWSESGYFDKAADTKPLLHLWSLGIEEQFYIVWPLLLGLVWWGKGSFLKITLLVAIASFAFNVVTLRGDAIAAFYSPLSRCWELMIGGILAHRTLRKARPLPVPPDWLSTLGLLLIVAALFLLDVTKAFPGWWALLPTMGAILIISAGSTAWVNKRLLSGRALVWIGLISYPLYLWHWPILTFVQIHEGGTPGPGLRGAAVVLSFVLAWLTFELLEKPIRLNHNPRAAAVLCVLMLFVGSMGYTVLEQMDSPGREAEIATAKTVKQATKTANQAAAGGTQLSGLNYDWKNGYRYTTCFLDAEHDASRFAPVCSGPAPGRDRKRPLVALWGDSHAAALYPGIEHFSKTHGYDIAQFTATGCPPILDFGIDRIRVCRDINSYVFSRIRELRPDVVILAGHWLLYDGTKGWNALDQAKIVSTVEQLRKSGPSNVVLFGHLPAFGSAQSKIGAQVFRTNEVDRTYKNFNKSSASIDKEMGRLAKELNVDFVSPIDLLCNESGCLVSVSRERLVPLAWDYAHLTEEGAVLLIDLAVKGRRLKLPYGKTADKS
jgi:peptidoglycan/LPS O-acetylase OafA/YrhL